MPDRDAGVEPWPTTLIENQRRMLVRRIPILAILSVVLVMTAVLVGVRPPSSGGAPGPTPTAANCSPTPGTLTITLCGNKFVDQNGQTVVLRGANTEGTQYDCAQSGAGFFDDPTVSGTDFSTEIAAMKAWGINVVRVNLNEECWLGINGVPTTTSDRDVNGYTTYANEMASYVNALNAAGIYAEVDLHLNAPGFELISDKGSNDDQNPMPESNSEAFWRSVGSLFVNNHAVIFGVFNEPFPNNYNSDGDTAAGWACDVNGCTIPHDCTSSMGNCTGVSYAGVGMRDLIGQIRSVDTTTPLLVGGPDFAGDMDDWLSTFYPNGVSIDPSNQLAASLHTYFPGGNSPCSVTTNVATACPSPDANAIMQVAAVTPVVVDEVGDFKCSASNLGAFLSSIDQANANANVDIGYVGWSWTTSSCDPNLLSSWTSGKPSTMGAAEYCQLYLDGLNDGSLATCSGTPVATAPPIKPPTTTTTTTTVKPPTTAKPPTPTKPPTTTPPTTTTTTTVKPPPTTTTTTGVPPTTTTTEPSTPPSPPSSTRPNRPKRHRH
jgi:Cellulase (glycosyl hydrolase family 5)